MNDELSGQLAAKGWRIPEYAQHMLWLESDSETVKVEGHAGLFELSVPAAKLCVRFGHPQGAVLARLAWQPDNLGWSGRVRVGGFVDGLHMSHMGAVEEFFGVIAFGGQPLKPGAALYARAADRQQPIYTSPNFYDLIDDEVPETTTTWITSEDSPLLTMAQDAMMNKSRVVFTGRLASNDNWDKRLALPLMLESVTLFAP